MTKTLLLHENAYQRVQDRLAQIDEPYSIVRLREDNTFFDGDKEIAEVDLSIDGAWMSNDFFRSDSARVFAVHILKSNSVKWLQTASAGLDNSFFQNVLEKGVRISNSDAQARAIAEYVMAQVLTHYHPTKERMEAQADHAWKRFGFRELYKTQWTIIGFGHIGMEIGKRARGFDAHVVGVRRSSGDHSYADAMATPDDLPDLLPQSDVVVLACPLSEATHHLANAAFFDQMKDGATLVNIGRGDLIDEPALLEGLDQGKPDFAILDVFAQEPLPETSPFWDHPRVAVSGHTSAFGSGTGGRGDELFLENLANFLAGRRLRNEVDPAKL
jgi:phosphoglycerate dehydrogenase-like enzyme